MSDNQKSKLAIEILAGLTTKEPAIAEAVTGGKHEVNGCGVSDLCVGQTP